jgi:hypothetical protein
MMATTPSACREAKRGMKFLFNWLPPTVPESYFLQDASILRMNRLEWAVGCHKSLREIDDPGEHGSAPASGSVLSLVYFTRGADVLELDEYFCVLDELAGIAVNARVTALRLFEEQGEPARQLITKCLEIRKLLANKGDREWVEGYLDTGLLSQLQTTDRMAGLLCVRDLDSRVALAELRRSCAPYDRSQPLFVAAPYLWDWTHPRGKKERELVHCKSLVWGRSGQLVDFGSVQARPHPLLLRGLLAWLRQYFPPQHLYIRLDPYDVGPDLSTPLEEAAVRPSDPDWWTRLTLYPRTRTGALYELTDCSPEENHHQYWEFHVHSLGRLEVAFRRDNSGLLVGMIEELPRLSDCGYLVGLCLHLTSHSPVGTLWDASIATHIDGAINVYTDGWERQRIATRLDEGKVFDASFRSHLFRVDTAPLRTLLPIARHFFRSECLVTEWFQDQFGSARDQAMHFRSTLAEG